ncbi:MAG: hypothetical protein VCF07_01800 [Nitrospinota bacterium]
MVDRVGQTPQLGGRNLGELVAARQSKQELLRSVSGPPATANKPSAPEPEPEQAVEGESQVTRAQQQRQQFQASAAIRQVAQNDVSSRLAAIDFAQVRELVGQALANFEQDFNAPAPDPPPEPSGGETTVQQTPESPESLGRGPTFEGNPDPVDIGGARPLPPPGRLEIELPVQNTQAAAETGSPPPETPQGIEAPEAVGGPAPAQTSEPPPPAVPETPVPKSAAAAETPGSRGDVVNVVA